MYKKMGLLSVSVVVLLLAVSAVAAQDSPYLKMLSHPELGWKPRRSRKPEKNPELSSSDARIRRELSMMLAEYAPRVWMHRSDPYAPTDPLDFIAQSSLHLRGPSGHETLIAPVGKVLPEELAKTGAANPRARPYQTGFAFNGAGYFLRNEDQKQGARAPASALALKDEMPPMFWRLGQGAFAQALAHARTQEDGSRARTRIVIEYWYHVPYNLATRIGIGNHQGDWEGVSMLVELEEKHAHLEHRLIAGFFSEHEKGTWRCADQVSRSSEDSRIEAFSAMGTHATYPEPGSHRNGILTDQTERGIRWDSWENLRPLALEPYYGYSGAWGEPRFFSFMTGPLVPGPGYKSLPRDASEIDIARCAH